MPIAAFAAALGGIDHLHDRELASALGDMVIAWSGAEYALINVFAAVTGVPWPMASIGYYQIPTFESRHKVLKAMLGKWETDRYSADAIIVEIDGLRRLARTRNHWIHARWVKQLLLPNVFTFDMREALPEARPVKAADIRNHVEAVKTRTRSIHHLIDLPQGHVPTPPGS